MDDSVRDDPDVMTRREIEHAAAALFCRFGDPAAEASRRGRLKGLLDASRTLSRALEAFVVTSAAPFRGQYSRTQIDVEVGAMADALVVWSQYITGAARLYHECRPEGSVRAGRVGEGVAAATSVGDPHAA